MVRPLKDTYTTVDSLYQFLVSEGYSGALNDMVFQYLGDNGETGSITDRIASFDGAVDTTAPEITNLTAGTQTDGDLPVSFDLSESGTIFWVLDSSIPNPEEVESGQASGGGVPSDSGSFSATAGDGVTREITFTSGLGGTYNLTFVGRDAAGNLASTVDTVSVNIDSTAPMLSDAIGAETGQTTATWGVTSNEAGGTIYAGVRPTAAAALTDTQLIAGSGGAGVAWDNDATPTADSANGGSFTGLTAATAYRVDTVQVDAQGNTSSVVSSAEFTTASSASIETLVNGETGPRTWLDFNDASRMSQTEAGTLGNVTNGDPIGRIEPRAGTVTFAQANTSERGVWDSSDGSISFAIGLPEHLDQVGGGTMGAGMTAAMVVTVPYWDPSSFYAFQIVQDLTLTTRYAGRGRGSNGDVPYNQTGTPLIRVNTAPLSPVTQGQLWDIAAISSKVLIYIENIDMSVAIDSLGGLRIGHPVSGTFSRLGKIHDFVLLPDQSSANRTVIENELLTKHGIIP